MANQTTSVKTEIFEWIKALLIAGVIVFLFRWLMFNPFIVDGESMLPNFHNADKLIVNKLIYEIRDPKRGEVIVFLAPEGKDYIKRVIGLPGERVQVDGDRVLINGVALEEPYIRDEVEKARAAGDSYNKRNSEEVTVPEDSLFVMGDNRPFSSDSRSPNVGFVPYDKIVGRAEFVYWPFSDIRLVNNAGEVKP